MDRRARRVVRRKVRARRTRAARSAWVEKSLDAHLPDAVADRLPGWMDTPRGRVVVAALSVVALLCWALVALLIVS